MPPLSGSEQSIPFEIILRGFTASSVIFLQAPSCCDYFQRFVFLILSENEKKLAILF